MKRMYVNSNIINSPASSLASIIQMFFVDRVSLLIGCPRWNRKMPRTPVSAPLQSLPAQHPDRLIDGLHIDLRREGRGAGILYLELANLLRLAVTIAPSQSVLTWVIGLLSTSGLNPIAGCPRHVHVTLYLPLAELSLLVIECR